MRKIRFIDCGANIGQTIAWAGNVFKNDDLKIDAFEPLPKNIEILRKNYSDSESITIHEAAASKSDGEATLYCQNWGARTGSSLIPNKVPFGNRHMGNHAKDSCNVKTIDLDKWLKDSIKEDEIVVLKIDIEGAEYDVIPHLFKNNIHNLVEYWLVEFHRLKTPNCNDAIEKETRNKVKVLADWSDLSTAEAGLKECGLIR